MKSFNRFQQQVSVLLGCAALVLATPWAAAMPLSNAHTSDSSVARTDAGAMDANARAYVELLDLQTRAIDHAAVAVEAAHEQNMHMVFVLSILAAILAAGCAWLAMARLTGQRGAAYSGGNGL
ncbi:hypothetical protein [Massilia sp. S19_KUP03_FR1]|uniref:hypothetical protein n=1 Tax=Massilia sp. S19_KUP03_FR1 TaxID=3025503 RepID=UPI002FCD9A82